MRSFTGTGLVVTALAATVTALLFPLWTYSDRTGTGTVDLTAGAVATPYGPLSALDRDFVERVRLAGLWELPAGQQAEERGTTAGVRRAGEHLVEGHTALDRHVRDVASRLGLELPSQPSAQQRQWLTRLSGAHGGAYGGAYDREFTNVLRLAHGAVFTVVAQVRATTRNTAVRELADDANTTVLDHIKVLEDTGLIDFDAIAARTKPRLSLPPSFGTARVPDPGSTAVPPLPPAATRGASPTESAAGTAEPGRAPRTDASAPAPDSPSPGTSETPAPPEKQ
ncbi:DUF4142 domain-containing protein [Streptomyces sp. ISL-11]|uniref:DUF4142 domain-containing protein n=1 Tax=Streptomyces sp. ISL-11 TaxID=2819174 RepID=UPI001BEB9211|nr:DUF4142 domain-containing protein [Streptomyces sp. ISL-11]MBT2382330.1 DUF4142 domain-containing protein [Streptomyces sp. ISL-11]